MKLTTENLAILNDFKLLNLQLLIASNYRNKWFTATPDGSIYHEVTFPKAMVKDWYIASKGRDGIQYETLRINDVEDIVKQHDTLLWFYDDVNDLELTIDEGDLAIIDEDGGFLVGWDRPALNEMNCPKKVMTNDFKIVDSVIFKGEEADRFVSALELAPSNDITIVYNKTNTHLISVDDKSNVLTVPLNAELLNESDCKLASYLKNGKIRIEDSWYVGQLLSCKETKEIQISDVIFDIQKEDNEVAFKTGLVIEFTEDDGIHHKIVIQQ